MCAIYSATIASAHSPRPATRPILSELSNSHEKAVPEDGITIYGRLFFNHYIHRGAINIYIRIYYISGTQKAFYSTRQEFNAFDLSENEPGILVAESDKIEVSQKTLHPKTTR